MALRPLRTHSSCEVKMTKYNALNLHGYIFTGVQNSQYFTKSKDFHLGLWILRSKAPFGPEQSGMICWNWLKMSAEVHQTFATSLVTPLTSFRRNQDHLCFLHVQELLHLSAQQTDRNLPRTGFGGDSLLICSCKEILPYKGRKMRRQNSQTVAIFIIIFNW